MKGLRDYLCGAVFAAIGSALLIYSVMTLPVGTATVMGPGYFPVLLSSILIALGAIIALSGLRGEIVHISPIGWRGVVLVSAAFIFFGVAIHRLGLVPSVTLSAFCAAYASRQISFWRALLLSLGLAVFAALIFKYGLGLSFTLFGPVGEGE